MKTKFYTLLTVVFFLFNHVYAQFNISLVKDIRSGSSSGPSKFDTINNKLLFLANTDTYGPEIWVSDGTAAGTQMLKEINPNPGWGCDLDKFVHYNNKLYFYANDGNGGGLWCTDGTDAGTYLVSNASPNVYYLTVFNGKMLFYGNDATHGFELWTSDGTTNGTVLLKDLNPGPDDGYPAHFTIINPTTMLFTANGITGVDQLWVTDGTTAGTQYITDPNPSGSNSWAYFTVLNNKAYFRATDGVHGEELWVSDGTLAGTQMVLDIAAGIQPSYPSDLLSDGTHLYFSAYDGQVHQVEPWISDGTAGGTHMLKDINTIGSSSPEYFTNYKSKVVFAADDGAYGKELWMTDGTASGTSMVKDIYQGNYGGCNLSYSIVYNNLLFFPGVDGSGGFPDLWVTDLTAQHTIKLVPPGATITGSMMMPTNFGIYNNELYMSAIFDTCGIELWKLSGGFASSLPEVTEDPYKLYPNPAHGLITLESRNVGEALKVTDLQGRLLLSFRTTDKITPVNLSGFSPGVYVLQVGDWSGKLMVE